ncbi:Pept-C1 domain-containing protein [Aphelenchoides bicaudatus]|nr:Pept-C1 domain-containing protein [Aphelenchoides bicaudatus]
MKLLFLFTFLNIAFLNAEERPNLIGKELVDYINQSNVTFKAQEYLRFKNLSIDQLKRFTGAVLDIKDLKRIAEKKSAVDSGTVQDDLPKNFDVWDKWPECAGVFTNIQDQSNCGSCYATSIAGALSDRRCITSNATKKMPLSAWDIASCCTWCHLVPWNGCDGGYPARVYKWFRTVGVVSGGPYKTINCCMPYGIAPHATKSHRPTCSQTCQLSYKVSYEEDKRKGGDFRYFILDNYEVMKELNVNGPVTAVFMVFSDFMHYKSGIYKHVAGLPVGLHSVRIVGYGTDENNVDFWRVANSWSTGFGENGMFRIRRGHNDCGFESYIIGGAV